MVDSTGSGNPRTFWKRTPDTIAAYLTMQELCSGFNRRAAGAPPDTAFGQWYRDMSGTVSGFGRGITALVGFGARGVAALATLGVSEWLIHFAKGRQVHAAGNQSMPPLDLVVLPHESALIFVDGKPTMPVTATRLATREFWQDLAAHIAGKASGHDRAPHIEVLMVDHAPFTLLCPFTLTVGSDRVQATLELTLEVSRDNVAKMALLVDRGTGSQARIGAGELNQAGAPSDGFFSTFITQPALAESIRRKVELRGAHIATVGADMADVRASRDAHENLERLLSGVVKDEFGRYGISITACALLLELTPDEQASVERRNRDRLSEQQRFDMERSLALDELAEQQRFALQRLTTLNDVELQKIAEEGARELDLLEFRGQRLKLREQRVGDLELDLKSEENDAARQRIKLQIDLERLELSRQELEVSRLAGQVQAEKIRMLKEIERDDALIRQRANTEAEQSRLVSAASLTPEQMLAALADKSPEAAKALAAKFSHDGSMAQVSAAQQLAMMKEMQTQMTGMMGQALEANAQVAAGGMRSQQSALHAGAQAARPLIAGTAAPATDASCHSCGGAVSSRWKACPFCGSTLTQL